MTCNDFGTVPNVLVLFIRSLRAFSYSIFSLRNSVQHCIPNSKVVDQAALFLFGYSRASDFNSKSEALDFKLPL